VYELGDLVFLASPKSGSTSLRDILPSVGFKKTSETNHHESVYTPGKDYFCVVRNHFDAMVSWCFFAKKIKGPPFDDLDELRLFMAAHPMYFGGYPLFAGFRKDIPALWRWVGTEYEPTVLRFEDFPRCAVEFLKSRGVEIGEIPHVNKSEERKGRTHKDVLSPEIIQYIWDRWGEEIEELGYGE